jgi:hypothetical protein
VRESVVKDNPKVVAGVPVQVKALYCEIDESIIANAKNACRGIVLAKISSFAFIQTTKAIVGREKPSIYLNCLISRH